MHFLVESRIEPGDGGLDQACEHARRVAEASDHIGYVRTTVLPGGATVLHLFDAPSTDVLERAGRGAGFTFERIVPATDETSDRRERSSDAQQ